MYREFSASGGTPFNIGKQTQWRLLRYLRHRDGARGCRIANFRLRECSPSQRLRFWSTFGELDVERYIGRCSAHFERMDETPMLPDSMDRDCRRRGGNSTAAHRCRDSLSLKDG